MCIPLRNWLVETTSAIGAASVARELDVEQRLRERGEQLDAVVANDGEVLDPHAAEAREVDAGLDRDTLPDLERVRRLRARAAAPRGRRAPTP